MPQFLRYERQYRMLQAEIGTENSQQIPPVICKAGPRSQTQFLDFEIPIAEIVPEKLPQLLGHFVISVLSELAVGKFGRAAEPAENPAIFQSFKLARLGQGRLNARAIHVH